MLKRGIMVLLIVLLFGGTALAYSWWDNLQTSESETITVGEGVTLEVLAQATAPSGKVLVPAGSVLTANDVDEIVLTYNVNLDKEVLEALNLTVVASNIEIGGNTSYSNLVNINITQSSSTVNSSNVLVSVTITVNEPSTYEIYQAIKNQPITFTLTFTGSQN